MDEDKGRAADVAARAEAAGEALHETRLAGAERSRERDDLAARVARAKHPAERLAERARLVRAPRADHEGAGARLTGHVVAARPRLAGALRAVPAQPLQERRDEVDRDRKDYRRV